MMYPLIHRRYQYPRGKMKLLRDRSGNALIMALAAGVIGGIIMSGLLTLLNVSQKDAAKVQQKLTVTDFQNVVRQLINNPNACTTSLGSLNFRVGDTSTYPQVQFFLANPTGTFSLNNVGGGKADIVPDANFATNRRFSIPSWSLTATVSADGLRINFSNGSFWTRSSGSTPKNLSELPGIWFGSADPNLPASVTGGKGNSILKVGDEKDGALVTSLRLLPPEGLSAPLPAGTANITGRIELGIQRKSGKTITPSIDTFPLDLITSTNASGVTSIIGCKWDARGLAGGIAGVSCPTAGQFLTGFDAAGTPICQAPTIPTITGGNCAADEYAAGISATGVPDCKKIAKPIICAKAGNQTPVMFTWNTVSFNAGDCGGQAPDGSYFGAATRIDICGGHISFRILASGEPGGPGIAWWPSVATGCTGYDFRAVYIKKIN